MAIGKTNAQRKILLTSEEITPTKSQQIITTPEDYDGLESVTVNAIPNNYIDTSDATATASDILSGETAYVDGSLITGTIATKTSSNLTASGETVTVPAGYYASTASKSVTTATQATPSISVSSAGKITASSTQTAGYVSAGTKSATKQLTTQAAKTWTPSTSSQSIAAGTYLTGKQTIAAIPSNYIDTSEGDATAAQILSGKKAYVDGSLVTGTMTNRGNVGTKTLNATTTSYTIPAGYHNGRGKVQHSTATQATPTISIDSSGLITASSTQSAGYVSSGTKSATKQLTTQAAKTWTPTTTDQTIASGTYCSGEQIIKGEPNLFAENLPRGLTLYGIEGTRLIQHEYWNDTVTISASTRDFQIPVDGMPQDGWPSCVHMRLISGTSISAGAVVAVGSSWKYSTFVVHDGWTYTFEIDDCVTTSQYRGYLSIEPPGSTSNFFPAGSYYVYLEFHYMYEGY